MYQVIRSRRRTLAIQVRPDGTVVVRAPLGATRAQIQAAVERSGDWIAKHQAQAAAAAPKPEERFTEGELRELAAQLKALLPERLARWSALLGVNYGKVTVRNQKSRWGSCSARGNLNFNCLLALAPPEVLDYVVVHELCHRKHMDHSPAFWNEVGRALPGYEAQRRWLRDQGQGLLRRMTG